MKRIPKEGLATALLMTVIFVAATILVATVDVKPVGVEGTNIGLAGINTNFFNRFGENRTFYIISSIGGGICFATAGCFGLFFLYQWFRRKSLSKVDLNLIVLVLLYIAVAVLYVLFNKFLVINYRPVMRDKGLESSYPSTHVMVAWTVMVSAVDQFNIYIKKQKLLNAVVICCFLVLFVVVISRMLSGVHWLTDIAGGILCGDMLIAWYRYAATRIDQKS